MTAFILGDEQPIPGTAPPFFSSNEFRFFIKDRRMEPYVAVLVVSVSSEIVKLLGT